MESGLLLILFVMVCCVCFGYISPLKTLFVCIFYSLHYIHYSFREIYDDDDDLIYPKQVL